MPFCKDNQRVYITRSDDDGLSWSEPEEITSDVKDPAWSYLGTGPGHGIQLKSGRLLIPCWFDTSPGPATWRNPPPVWGRIQSSYACFSDDGGRTWQRGEEMGLDASDECEAVELENGAVYMTMRSRQDRKCRAFARSYNGGQTWSSVEYDASLPEPSCQASVVRLDKTHLLLSHPSNTEARTMLTVRMSRDECRTWPVARILHEGLASYSDMAIANGHILCFYETGAGEHMILARFTMEWLSSTSCLDH